MRTEEYKKQIVTFEKYYIEILAVKMIFIEIKILNK